MLNIIEKDISKLATIRTKAYTKFYTEVNNIDELREASLFAKQNNLKLQVIGNGTNILFSKEVYENILFIKLRRGFNFFRQNNEIVEIGASFSFIRAGEQLVKQGYKDFIYMCLIPGSMGGGIRQNAGTTNEGEISNNLINATVYDLVRDRIVSLSNEEMKFSYRNSYIQQSNNRYIVLSATFKLKKKIDDIKSLQSFLILKKQTKKDKEPKGYSFGSTFKTAKNAKPSWYYIDKVGMCEENIGGARFSKKHANWIVNSNNASGYEIVKLINMAKQRVYNTYKISLEEEVEII